MLVTFFAFRNICRMCFEWEIIFPFKLFAIFTAFLLVENTWKIGVILNFFFFSRELAFFGVEEDKPIRNGNKTLTFLALLRTYLGVDNFHFKSALTTLPKFFISETKNISTFYLLDDNVKRAYLELNPPIFFKSETIHFLWFWSYLQHQYILCILKRIQFCKKL